MDGSPSSVVSLGFGSWGSVGLVVTLGFGSGEEAVDPSTLYGWLEARCTGRLHSAVSGRLHSAVSGRLHGKIDEED